MLTREKPKVLITQKNMIYDSVQKIESTEKTNQRNHVEKFLNSVRGTMKNQKKVIVHILLTKTENDFFGLSWKQEQSVKTVSTPCQTLSKWNYICNYGLLMIPLIVELLLLAFQLHN